MASQDVQVRIGTLDQYLTPRDRQDILETLACDGVGRIKRRTGQGKDVDGKAFAPYSKRYAKQRQQSGRNASPPTLLLSGAMLNGMTVIRSDERVALIGFEGSAAATRFTRRTRAVRTQNFHGGGTRTTRVRTQTKSGATHAVSASATKRVANALKARWNDQGDGKVPRRHFFGLSRQDRLELTRKGIRLVIEKVRAASFKRLSSAGALRQARRAGR